MTGFKDGTTAITSYAVLAGCLHVYDPLICINVQHQLFVLPNAAIFCLFLLIFCTFSGNLTPKKIELKERHFGGFARFREMQSSS